MVSEFLVLFRVAMDIQLWIMAFISFVSRGKQSILNKIPTQFEPKFKPSESWIFNVLND